MEPSFEISEFIVRFIVKDIELCTGQTFPESKWVEDFKHFPIIDPYW